MTWLLDTHALLWALFEPRRLGATARAVLAEASNDVRVSTLSYWEISLKHGLGKLVLPDTDPEEIPSAARNLGLAEEAPSAEVLASIHRLLYAPAHRDPFDRLLVWQAICGGHTLLSKDRSLAFFRSHGLRCAW